MPLYALLLVYISIQGSLCADDALRALRRDDSPLVRHLKHSTRDDVVAALEELVGQGLAQQRPGVGGIRYVKV